MNFELLLVGIGLAFLLWLWAFTRQLLSSRRRMRSVDTKRLIPVNLLNNNNAVIVAEGRGHLLYINKRAHEWFGLNGNTPNLSLLATKIHPTDVFHDLFAEEGRATLRLGLRRVEAASHSIPTLEGRHMVIVLRQLDEALEEDQFDSSSALVIIQEISQTITRNLDLSQTMNTILQSVGRIIPYDSGEITLWDQSLNALRSVGHIGNLPYLQAPHHNGNGASSHNIDDGYSGWIARYRQPLLLGDVKVRPDVKPQIEDFPYQSYIGLPLVVNDRFIGTLELASTTRYAFDHEDLSLLESIAGQAAIAIENARLAAEQANRLLQLTGLQSIAQTMSDQANPRELYSILHERIASLIHVDFCGILLYQPETETLTSQLPFFGAPDTVISLYNIPVPKGSVAEKVWQQDQWWYSNDVLRDEKVGALNMRGLAEAIGIRNAALVPLSIGNTRIGFIQVANKRSGIGFNEDDMRLLSIFASQTTIVIENSHLYERERHYIAELASLQEMTQLERTSDSPALFTEINNRIASLLQVEICGFLLYDNTVSQRILVAQAPFYGLDDESLSYVQVAVTPDSIFETLTEIDEGYWLSNELSQEKWTGGTNFVQLAGMIGIKKIMIAPLLVNQNPIGILLVANKSNGQDFNRQEGRILSIAARQAAVLIENINLYRSVQQLSKETGGLRRIAETVASSQTIDGIIKNSLADIQSLTDSQIVGIGLLETTTGNLVYSPATVLGPKFDQPITIDIYGGDFNQSPAISRQSFLSNDIYGDKRVLPPYEKMAQRFSITKTLIVPLSVNQHSLGELALSNKQHGNYDESDQQLALAIAAQLAAAIERTRLPANLDTDLRTRIYEQEALDRINHELNQTLLLDRILEVIRGEALRTTNADDASVVLFNPPDEWENTTTPKVEARLASQSLTENTPTKDSLLPIEQRMFQSGETVYIPDYSSTDLDATPPQAHAAIAQPIRFGDDIAGIIHIFTHEKDVFNDGTLSFINRLGQQASLAVSNARRYRDQLRANERLRRRAHQVQQIFTLSQMLREGASLAELMQEVAYAISETVGFDKVAIRTLDEREQVFRMIAQAGLPLEAFEAAAKQTRSAEEVTSLLQPRWKISNSYFFPAEAREEWSSPTIKFINEHSPGQVDTAGPKAWNPRDLLVVPVLNSAGGIVGTVSVDDPYDQRRPDIETIELLEVFATQAAFIIENFRLVENVQQEAESARRERDRLAQLHLVSSEIQRAQDMTSRLQAVADGIVAAGWQHVQITLRDEHLEPTQLISSGYQGDDAQRLHTKLLPGKIWQNRFSDLAFHDLKIGSAYYMRYDAAWVQKNILRGEPASPRIVDEDKWHPQDVLYLPLIGHDQKRIIGLIRMENPTDGLRPTEDSLQPIELFALQASAAIENTRLYSETVRQAETEQRLNQLMEAMASTLDQTEIIRALAAGLQPFVLFTRMHLALPMVDKPRTFEMIRVELTPDGKVHIFPDNSIEMDRTAMGMVHNMGQLQIFDLTVADIATQFTDLHNWAVEGERAILMVPLIAGGDKVGILRLGSELDQSFRFTEDASLTLIQRMANLSAVSIQNSRLFSSLDESRSFNQAVVQSIQQGIVVLDNQMNLTLINAYMVRHYDWEDQAIGRNLFAYRPEFRDFLEHSLQAAIDTGQEQHQFDVQDVDADGKLIIRNFYTYPLRQGERITGVVLLVEDITQRALLEADLSNRAEQLSALTTVSSKMTETLQPDQVVEVVLDALDNVIPYDGVALWLLDPDEPTSLEIVAARGFNDQGTASATELIGLRVEIEDSILFREMSAHQEAVNVGDTGNDPRFPYGEGRVYKNFLAAPLVSKGEILGILQLEKLQPNFYGGHHEQLVLAFANQAAVALNNAKLFAETQDRAEQLNLQADRLTLLNRVSVNLSQSLDIENIFEITLRETALALGVEEAAAIQINPEDNICRVVIEYPRGEEEPNTTFPLAQSTVIQRIRETLLPLRVENIDRDPMRDSIRMMLRHQEVRGTLFVPLVMSGSVIGIMRFDIINRAHYFTNEQIDLAQTLASQAAIAVQNASLYEQSVQRTYQLETLFEAGQATASALDINDVMRRVATQMLIALRADSVQVMRWDQIENILVVDEAKSSLFDDDEADLERKGVVYDLHEFKLRENALRYQQVMTLRFDAADLDEAERAHMASQEVSNRLLVPLIVNELSIGLAQIDIKDKSRYFEAGQVRLIRTLANQAAIAIENARLQSETRTQIEELYLINDLSKAVSSTVELDVLLEQVRIQLPILTDAEYLYVALYDDSTNTISFPVAINLAGDEVPLANYQPQPSDEFGYIIQRHTSLLLAGTGLDQVRKNIGINAPLFPAARCFLGVPMIVGDQIIGILALRDDQDSRKFDFKDQRILTIVSAQLGVAIQNANLFRQIRSSAEDLEKRVSDRTVELDQERQRLSTLYEIASEIAAGALDLDRVLSRTLESVSEAIGASTAIVLAIDDISDNLYVIAQRGLDVTDETERLQLRQNEGLAGWIIQNRQGVVIADVQNDPRWITITERDRHPRSAVATLLESADDVRGVIMFYNEKPKVFNDDHLRLVTAAASQLANSMNNAELYSLIRDQAERLGAILRQEQVESTKNAAILNSVADGVMYANEKGIIRVFNNTAETILGLSSDQVLNRHIRELTGIYGGRESGWMDAIENWMADPTQHQSGDFIEVILNLSDDRVISVRLSPVNMGDQFLGTVSVFRDITQEVEVDRLKSEFVATVSHELRTPMTSIKGYADLLLLGAAGELTEVQQRFLQTIKQNADRLSILVNDLLEVSRIDQGRMPLRFLPVDVAEVIQIISNHLSGRIKDTKKTLQVQVEMQDNLPFIRADFDKIVQALQNIADNAFNYTPPNGTITIAAHNDPDDKSVLLSISDTGIGIPENVQHRVFERFFRGDEFSELVMDTPGTGLGLAIVKELVNMHNGEIWFESVVGQGTTFFIKIPAASEQETQEKETEHHD